MIFGLRDYVDDHVHSRYFFSLEICITLSRFIIPFELLQKHLMTRKDVKKRLQSQIDTKKHK